MKTIDQLRLHERASEIIRHDGKGSSAPGDSFAWHPGGDVRAARWAIVATRKAWLEFLKEEKG
jgi:hypothetical protein